MNIDRTTRNIIIIGASSGIGKALAIQYGQNKNVKLGLLARRSDLLKDIANQLQHKCETQTMDVTNNDSTSIFKEFLTKFEKIDLVIYCAGFGEVNPELNWELCKTTLEVNIFGFTSLINQTYKYMNAQQYGQIAVISSVGGLRGFEDDSGYSASKAYQINYFEGLSRKTKKAHMPIKINTILPGFVDTAMAKGGNFFWMCSPEKAAKVIICGLNKNKRYIFVTPKWRLIGWLLKFLPYKIFERYI